MLPSALMFPIYLFDWGDTLMVDFPDQQGPMCSWPEVAVVKGAAEALHILAARARIYVATNAADSTEQQIKQAFERAGLADYISGYFCHANLGIGKGSPQFFHQIAAKLNVPTSELIMVGDTLENDILPAIAAGAQAIWLHSQHADIEMAQTVPQITSLRQLIAD